MHRIWLENPVFEGVLRTRGALFPSYAVREDCGAVLSTILTPAPLLTISYEKGKSIELRHPGRSADAVVPHMNPRYLQLVIEAPQAR